jgi:hypothetical protein
MRALQTKCPYRTEREKPKNGAGNQQNGIQQNRGYATKFIAIQCDIIIRLPFRSEFRTVRHDARLGESDPKA